MAALFSGGLDSLAGLCREFIDCPPESVVLLCGGTNGRTVAVQRRLIAALRTRLGKTIIPVIVPFGLRQRGSQYDGDERTQRTRGFVYQTLGAVTAIMAGADSLAVYEPGVGAINLAYTTAQLGTQSARACHPQAVAAMGDLIRMAVGKPFKIRLPFPFFTKAQLCTSLPELGLSDLVEYTVSCDGFPQRVPGRVQCGLCTSCLLRRQAVFASGLMEYDATAAYVNDVFDPMVPLPQAKLYPLRAMLDQVETLQHTLDCAEPWKMLSRRYPQLLEVAVALSATGRQLTDIESQIVDLYRRYCSEWEGFPPRR
ncbi:7-cyano-7-deazaguanine synthase [Nitrolancea hollandica]|nr:7-cyano-7-deazaguanine synthase [Nitrolancea hollandica]